MTVNPVQRGVFTINVRIPGWARGEAVPSDLYRFADSSNPPVMLKVSGKNVAVQSEKGYVGLKREWKAGDVIELNLPMPVRRIVANDNVAADRGRTAIQRGPLVYCAEWPDNPGGRVRNLVLPEDAKLRAEFKPDLLNGVTVVKGKAVAVTTDPQGSVTRKEQDFTAIPYYAWANRGKGEMIVWIPDKETGVKA
jgi:hypothetical protein